MAVDVFADTRSRIRTLLQDAAGTYWSDAELDTWINDAQTDYALRTKSLLKSLPIINLENSEIYDFPEDYLDFVRMTDKDGNEIDLTNWKWLRDQYGENFHKTTGQLPMYAYTDLTPPGKFRFYPTPDPTVLASMTTFQNEVAPYFINNQITADFKIKYKFCPYKEGVAFVNDLDEVWYWVYGRNPKRLATGMNGLISAGDTYVWILDPITGNVSIMSETLAAVTAVGPFTAAWNQYPKIYAVNPSIGTEFLIACGAANTYRITLTEAGVLASTELTFSGASQTLLGFSYISRTIASADYQAKFVVNEGGTLKTFEKYTSLLATAVDIVGWTLTPNNYVGDVIVDKYGYSYSLSHTGTGFSLLRNSALYLSLETYLYCPVGAPPFAYNSFYYNPLTNILYITGLSAVTNTSTTTIALNLITGAISTIYPVATNTEYIYTYQYANVGNVDYALVKSYSSASTNNSHISIITPDDGELVYADAVSFVSDEGIITDIVDTDDTALFDGQEGSVVQVIDTDEACTLWYNRYPASDTLEFTNTLPLVYYSVMQAYLKEADMQNFAKAQIFQQMYQREVDRFNSRQRKSRPILHNQ